MGIGAATVTFDTNIEDATVTRTIKGTEIVRMALVEGLDAEVNEGHALLGLAIDATDIRVGVDFHPTRTDLVCTRIDARHKPDSPSKAEITFTYGIPVFDPVAGDLDTQEPQITGGVVVQSATTSRDIHRNPILLEHTLHALDELGRKIPEPKEIPHPTDSTAGPIPNPRFGQDPPLFVLRKLESIGKIEVLRPMYTFGLTRRESSSPARNARFYVGTTSFKAWFGFRPDTVLCTGITFTSSDGGETFNTTYSFQENLEGWMADIAIVDPETGEFAVGVPNEGVDLVDPRTQALNTTKQARWNVEVYRRTNFNKLRLLAGEGTR